MWGLDDLKQHREILDRIDWEMTPEKAVETFLEWGTGWARKGDFARYPGEDAVYFVIYDWEKPPQVTLLRQSSQDTNELAKVPAPEELVRGAIKEGGRKPGVGVYAITGELKDWLRGVLDC